jgi:ferric-dicitrate binding protein FerR (iron transport regulator)
MENSDEYMDEILARHLAGEASPDDKTRLQSWLSESAENRSYFAGLQKLWEHAPNARPPFPRAVDTEAALQRVKTALHHRAKPLAIRSAIFVLLRAAAVLLPALAAVYWLWLRPDPLVPTVVAAAGSGLTDTLSDGSVVYLNRQSGLALAKDFNTRERRVRLQGTIFFEVAPDTTRPFVVEVQDLEVRVVGTAFEVDYAPDSARVHITVSEGKVRVSARDRFLLLTAGEGAVYDTHSGSLQRATEQQNPALARMFRFDETPLREVVQKIEKTYGISITLKNKVLENCLLTGRYNNLPPDRLLSLIADSFSLEVSKLADNEYVLDGTGCGD